MGLLLLLPLFAAIGVAIKLFEGGPIFYRQARVGLGGRPFNMVKFRSMVTGADKGSSLTFGRDPRVTPVGRVLRNTKLDELPQLWNVLVGDMSFVGPRPEVSQYVELYSPMQRAILNLKPGITSLGTLAYYDESDLLSRAADPERFYVEEVMPQKIDINLDYAGKANLYTDALLMFATVARLIGVKLNLFLILHVERPRVKV
jgi:lipopolysaccharide/colanic/teichoic acid biosynthesis glycosyltransferase